MGEDIKAPMITVSAPEGYTPEAGKPISFQVPATSIDWKSIAPKEIGEKDYFKKINTIDDLFKTLDGAQTLIGQKPKYAVPAADAPPEELEAFFKGVDFKEEQYGFEDLKDMPAEMKAPAEVQGAFKKMFSAAKLHPAQAKILEKGYNELMMAQHKANQASQAAIDKQFTEITKGIVGEDPKVASESLARSKRILEYLLPKELHPFIAKANNEGLAMMVGLTKIIEKKYMKEDELPADKETSGGQGPDALRAKAMEKQKEAMALDSMNPQKKVLMDEATALYKQYEQATRK